MVLANVTFVVLILIAMAGVMEHAASVHMPCMVGWSGFDLALIPIAHPHLHCLWTYHSYMNIMEPELKNQFFEFPNDILKWFLPIFRVQFNYELF